MSDKTWWTLMVAWGGIVVGIVGWIWLQVRKEDAKIDASDALTRDLLTEMRTYNRRRALPLPPADIDDEYYHAFMNDTPEPPPKRAA